MFPYRESQVMKNQTIVWREYVFAANKSSSDGVLPILILKSNVSSVDPSSERNTRETRCQHMYCITLVHQHGGQKTKAQIKPNFNQNGQI